MRIAYCEDEPAQRSRMELLLRTFAERKRLPLTVEAFSDSAAFLFQYPGSYPFDLIFLDIDLGGMDGMALARKIRETDSEVPILFLTNHKEYVFEGYEVQAFRYLLKPVTEDTLFPLLEELQAIHSAITADIFNVLTVEASVASRKSFGGTAPLEVRKQIAWWRQRN